MIIDKVQYKKYDVQGPRYTSYPPAPHFNESFTDKKYRDALVRSNLGENSQELSLYFHIPFCDTLCYFCGCNMFVTRNRERIKRYLQYLKKEIDILAGYLLPERPVSQIHWGGGTPTHLSPEEINELAQYISSKFNIKKNAEISCEIDPRELTKEHLIALRNNGFNRISLGVQDFSEKVQVAVNRIQPESLTQQVIDWIRELKFESLNIDLMYGLPFQTIESFEETLDKVIKISPDRIAVFNYAHVPWMKKHMEMIKTEDLPTADIKLNILQLTINKLTDAKYVFIGMDHFAKPSDELSIALKEKKLYRNFQGYSTHSGTDLIALGISGISQLNDVYSQNVKKEVEYFNLIDEGKLPVEKGYMLTDDDHLRRKVIMKLMCDYELDITSIENEFRINFNEYFSNSLEKLKEIEKDDLVEISAEKIRVKGMGIMIIRNIAMMFDGFIERNDVLTKYSRTL